MKLRTKDHEMIRLMVFAVNYEGPVQKRPGYRDIFPSQSRIFIQKLDALGPLLLKSCSEFKLQAARKIMFSPPRRKHLAVVLEIFMLPSFSKDCCRAPRCPVPVTTWPWVIHTSGSMWIYLWQGQGTRSNE